MLYERSSFALLPCFFFCLLSWLTSKAWTSISGLGFISMTFMTARPFIPVSRHRLLFLAAAVLARLQSQKLHLTQWQSNGQPRCFQQTHIHTDAHTHTQFSICVVIFRPSDLLSFSSPLFSCLPLSPTPVSCHFILSLSLSLSSFFLFHFSLNKFSCSIWVAVEIKGALFNLWIERNKWRRIRRAKGKVKKKKKRLTGNWSRAKYLVLHYHLYSLFSLFLNFSSFQYPAQFSCVI